jgi:serine/threonine protein kinase
LRSGTPCSSQGMNYLHTCKPPIMHRDLKPENLLLDYAGVIKVPILLGLKGLAPGTSLSPWEFPPAHHLLPTRPPRACAPQWPISG